MIHRVFIDNYKCFASFECHPAEIQLVLGDNGAGKTSLFDILEILRDFLVRGTPSSEAFPTGTLTAWDKRSAQTFELGLAGNGGDYQYRLVIEHDRRKQRNRIKSEELQFDHQPLYQFDGHDAHLFRDDGTTGPIFPFDWSRSAISSIPERDENQKLTWFRNRMERVYVFSPDPVGMTAQSDTELQSADRRLHHFASWLRHVWQQGADFSADLRTSLQQIVDGLDDIKLESVGEGSKTLKFKFQFAGNRGDESSEPFWLAFDQLSDGQRSLVALHTILLAAVHPDATVCLDEPDNFVSLREIQPWLTELRDRVQDHSSQCLLVSHHPDLINYLAAKHGQVFFRDDSGPVRAKPFEWNGDEILLPAELIARGWK